MWYFNLLFKGKFETIKSKTTLVHSNVTLADLFKHILNIYQVEFNINGLIGVYKLRKAVIAQIKGLTISNFYHKDKTYSDLELKDSLKHLYIFKDIIGNIRFTLELLQILRGMLLFISSAAIIPVIVLSYWVGIRFIFRWASYLFTIVVGLTLVEAKTDHNFNIGTVIEWLRTSHVTWHNWVFQDDMVSAKTVKIPRYTDIFHVPTSTPQGDVRIPKGGGTYSIWGYLPSAQGLVHSLDWVDWSLVGYTAGAFIILSTGLLVYTGTIDPIKLIKGWGGLIASYFIGSSDDGDAGGSGNTGGSGNGGGNITVFDASESASDDEEIEITDNRTAKGLLLTNKQKETLARMRGLPVTPTGFGVGEEENWKDSTASSSSRSIAPDYQGPDWKDTVPGTGYNKEFADSVLTTPEREEYNDYFKTESPTPSGSTTPRPLETSQPNSGRDINVPRRRRQPSPPSTPDAEW